MKKHLICIIILFTTASTLFANDSLSIADFDDYKKLLRRPAKISSSAVMTENKEAVALESDYHLLSEIPLQTLSNLLINLDGADEIFSRIAVSIDLSADKPIDVPHKQEIHTSFKFLWIGPEYKYRVNVYFDKVSENEFSMYWKLYDSMGTDIQQLEGSWYLKQIDIDDNSYTYIRNTASSTVKNPPSGMVFFTNTFGGAEVKNTFNELLKAAKAKYRFGS